MKVLICPDLHLDITGISRIDPLLKLNPDWIMLAGDISQWDSWDIHLLTLIEKFPKSQFALVPGNHDFYCSSKAHSLGKTEVRELIELQKDFCKNIGIHYLPSENLILKETTFVGSGLWYDYSFINEEDYEEEDIILGYDHAHSVVWNDMKMIYKKITDKDLCQLMLKEFEQRISESKGKVIAITHMLPHKELNAHEDSLLSAYSGCTRAGMLLDSLESRLVKAYCGHTHRAATFGKYINIGNDYGGELKYVLLEI